MVGVPRWREAESSVTTDDWRLRRATLDDVDGLHGLASKPLVYRYLFDGAAPSRELITARVARRITEPPESCFGMWLLEGVRTQYRGLTELRPYSAPRSTELTYLLDPDLWGRGLAVRMAWTAITLAFRSGYIDSVIAGADLPNSASLSVMQRLGMQFHKDVVYPLGAGTEYVLHRVDANSIPRPALIPLIGAPALHSPTG